MQGPQSLYTFPDRDLNEVALIVAICKGPRGRQSTEQQCQAANSMPSIPSSDDVTFASPILRMKPHQAISNMTNSSTGWTSPARRLPCKL